MKTDESTIPTQTTCMISAISDSAGVSAPQPLQWDDLALRLPPRRDWVMDGWIPAGQTTLLSGRGGKGKTAVAQHIATCVAFAHTYIDSIPVPGPVLMWAGEDDETELWRRQLPICDWLGIRVLDLTGKLHMYSFADNDMSLAETAFGTLRPTPLMRRLKDQVDDIKPRLVILDNVSRIFGGAEQDRHHVMTFCAWLRAACAPAAILLLGHTAKPTDSEYSGSTAWENAARSRLLFDTQLPGSPPVDDEGIDSSVRYLSRRKLNSPGGRLTQRLQWQDDVLVPVEIVKSEALTRRFQKGTLLETHRALI